MDDKAIYLSLTELFLIFLQKDFSGLLVFEEMRNLSPTDEELSRAVCSLVEKKVLRSGDNDTFHFCGYMKDVLDIIEYSNFAVTVYGRLSSIPMQCLFFRDGEVVSMEMDEIRPGNIRISHKTEEQLVSEICSYEFLPVGEGTDYEEEIPCDSRDENEKEISQMLGDSSVLLIYERYPRNSIEAEGRFSIVTRDDGDYILIRDGDSRRAIPYGKDRFENAFRNFIKEDENDTG